MNIVEVKSRDEIDYAEFDTLMSQVPGLAISGTNRSVQLDKMLRLGHIIVARAENSPRLGGLIGFYSNDSESHTAQIIYLVVSPDFRRQGIGRKLIDAALHFSRSCGMKFAELLVVDSNEKARALYSSMGFELCGYGKSKGMLRLRRAI